MKLQQAYLNVAARLPSTPDIKVRLDRAYDIIRCNGEGYSIQLPFKAGQPYTVHKASTSLLEDTSVSYTVTPQSCTCPDAAKTRTGLCKHRLAILLLQEMGEHPYA